MKKNREISGNHRFQVMREWFIISTLNSVRNTNFISRNKDLFLK